MKIQELGIIFIIIIIPMSLILSVYTQFQIETLNIQTEYDSKLTSATYDAIKAFQINTANSTMSDISNSKIRDIEASVNTFKKSLMSTFGLNGITDEDLNTYIPALVYTMYDGFYIYAPFENTNYLYKAKKDANGNILYKNDGTIDYELDENGEKIPIDNNDEVIYGLRPYISYSARYKKGTNTDIVITYALDNYIVIQGTLNGTYIYDEGYLIDDIEIIGDINDESCIVKYNGVEIEAEEELTEYVGDKLYPYIKINGTKYYYDASVKEIFYLMNGTRTTQYKDLEAQNFYMRKIENNTSAKEYYKNAYIFTNNVRNVYNLKELTFNDAYVNIVNEDGTIESKQLLEGDTRKIFAEETGANAKNIENKTSNFNQHRLEIIRQSIEQNLSVVIANYNKYSGTAGTGIEFQMPELKEDEWDLLLNNISLISFVQGLNIGGKIYNGYTIVNNTETKELIREEDIYIIGIDNCYHKIGDKYLNDSTNIDTSIPSGRLSLDFKRNTLVQTINSQQTLSYYYPRREDASYNSIITKDDFTIYEDIYTYIDGMDETLKKVFYTALGREREGQYKSLLISDELFYVEMNKIVLNYDTAGAENQDLFTMEETVDGKFVINPNIPTKVGNNFLGWTTDSTSKVVEYTPNESIELTESKVLYAIWALKEYRITYKFNGAPSVEPSPAIKFYDQPIQINCAVEWEGHDFLGWSLSSTSTTVDFYQGDIYTQNADMKLYAVWKDKQYTIKYDANGGISAPEDQIKIHGVNITLSSTIRQRIEYDFIGWSENPSATTPEYLPGSTYSENKNVTLYAIWKRKTYTVTYNANGGSGAPESQTKEYGITLKLSNTKPTRDKYTFLGWSTSKNATTATYKPNGDYTMNSDITLYAVWKSNQVKLVNMVGGSDKTKTQLWQDIGYDSKKDFIVSFDTQPGHRYYVLTEWKGYAYQYGIYFNYKSSIKFSTSSGLSERKIFKDTNTGFGSETSKYSEIFTATLNKTEIYSCINRMDNSQGGNTISIKMFVDLTELESARGSKITPSTFESLYGLFYNSKTVNP